MIEVEREFINRKSEIEEYYTLLENIIEKEAKLSFPDERKEIIQVDLRATLKAGAILLLYNLVESTISNSVKEIHRAFSDENIKYIELSDKIQEKILKHYYSILKKQEGITEANRITELRKMVSIFNMDSVVKLYHEDFVKYNTGSEFSGNLDAKTIRNVINSYGLEINMESNALRVIKDKRNKLSHGELSFRETCNNDTMPYMNVLKNNTFLFLEEVLSSIKTFINDKKYLR